MKTTEPNLLNFKEIDFRKIVLLSGGAGDFLQNLPFLVKHNNSQFRYFVATHFHGAMDIFKHVGINIERIMYYDNINELNSTVELYLKEGELYDCPRESYFHDSPFRITNINFEIPGKIVGIHLGGSRYSIDLQKKHGLIPKNLPKGILDGILTKDFNIILFGSQEEIDDLGIPECKRLRHVCFPEISRSLSIVENCNAFIGSDSVFKTMSSMLKIPTLVLLGDYIDNTRDKRFINPYVKESIMQVHRYKDLEYHENLSESHNAIFNFLNNF